MFRRQKILISLLEQFGGTLSRTQLQKLLFLYCEENDDPVYEFVPYRFGCFSFQAAADQRKLVEKGLLAAGDRWLLARQSSVRESLPFAERDALWRLRQQYGALSQRELIRHVYLTYPYYASRSEIAGDHLTDKELIRVRQTVPKVDARSASICSIGYEGLTLEGYLNRLIRHDVQVVCDVRRNPLSRKHGFSKSALSSALTHVGVTYVHLPELGIVSAKRRALESQADYDALFAEYEQTTLADSAGAIRAIADILADRHRIALLCYERLPQQCHRTRVLDAVLARYAKPCRVFAE